MWNHIGWLLLCIVMGMFMFSSMLKDAREGKNPRLEWVKDQSLLGYIICVGIIFVMTELIYWGIYLITL